MMKNSLAVTFNSMVTQCDFKDAMCLISNISGEEIPLPTVVNSIIFNILMKNCKESIAKEASAYLDNYLNLLPTKNPSIPYNYREVLQDQSGVWKDIWSVFSHLVESSFRHYKISSSKEKSRAPKFVKYPNCDILIGFYGEMLTKFLSFENDFFNESEEQVLSLLEWINTAYKQVDIILKDHVLETLHTLLEKKLKFEFSHDPSSQDIPAFINLILRKCPNVFSSERNMRMFCASLKFPYLNVKICQHKLYELINKKKLRENNKMTWTLKTILYNYFFHNNSKVEAKKKTCASTNILKNSTNSPKHIKERFFPKNITGGCSLHDFCHKNLYGDLYEVLLVQSYLNPNPRNSGGRTPLHEACLSNSYYCAKFLLEEFKSEGDKINLKAVDNEGLTPLHCAAYVNAMDVAQILLKHGGAELVTVKDKYGEKPIGYAKSKKMKNLLECHEPSTPESTDGTSSSNYSNLTLPVIKDKEEYSIYLLGLHIILSHYLKTFNLYNCVKNGVAKLSHNHRKCAHYGSVVANAVCDEDAAVFMSLPLNLEVFIASVRNANGAKGLLPLLVLGRMVKSSLAPEV